MQLSDILFRLGIYRIYQCHDYVFTTVTLACQDPELLQALSRRLYPAGRRSRPMHPHCRVPGDPQCCISSLAAQPIPLQRHCRPPGSNPPPPPGNSFAWSATICGPRKPGLRLLPPAPCDISIAKRLPFYDGNHCRTAALFRLFFESAFNPSHLLGR